MSATMTAPTKPAAKTSARIFNYSAGPGCLPEEVLRQCQEDIWNIGGSGIGIMEHSHRGKVFDRILEEAEADCREVGNIPKDYHVLFLTGGASTQNFMIPANLLPQGGTADYFNTGYWAQKSIEEGRFYGNINVCASSEDTNHSYIPSPSETKYSPKPAYVHYTSNNTIFGTEFHYVPAPPPGVPLVCDASSDIFSAPIDIAKFSLVYAGAQKNLGPAGTTVVLVRDDLLARCNKNLPTMLRYPVLAKEHSRYNTPPVFPIYVVGLVFKWIKNSGGLAAMEKHNREKAKLIYDVLDSSKFYHPHARTDSRSLMNLTFRTPSEQLDDKFLADAKTNGMDGLKGHRATGGMRASIYNAFPRAGCEALAQFMRDFERRNG